MIIKRGLADEAPRTLARWYASLRAKGNIALAGATIALVLLALGLTFVAGAFAYRQGLVSGYEKSVMRRLMHPVSYVRSFTAPTLPRLTVDMKLKHLRKVEAKREEAIQRGILFSSDDDYVPAQLRFDGRGIPVKMRLKGDTWPHFAGDKWSFRIKLNEDDRLFGMRRFSIQSPATRGYIDGWAALENFSHEGVLSPRLSFVNITFNGADKGIYALEEFFAKEMVEAQGRRSGVIVAFHEDIFWIRRDQLAVPASIRQELFHYENAVDPQDHRSRIIDTFASGAVQRDPALVKQRDEAIRLLRGFQQQTLRPSEIFDIRLLARYLAIVELWSAPHGTAPNNIRFYYNPISARLEPVGSEPGPGFRVDSDTASLFALETTWVREALGDPVVAGAYVEELRRVSSEEYLHELEAAIGKDLELSLVALHREWPQLTTPWGKLRARQEVLRATLRPPSLVQALHLPSGVEMNGPALGETNPSAIIHVANMFPLPTEVIGFKVDDGPLVAATDFLATSDLSRVQVAEGAVVLGARRPGESLSFAVFSVPVPAQGVSDQLEGASAIMVVNWLIGSDGLHETIAIPYTPIAVDTAIPSAPTVGEALALHPYLEPTSDPSMLQISPGVWTIEADIVLPEEIGLYIGPGTTLRFAPSAMLLARGPLLFLGTAEQPVILGPSGESWPGVAVLEAGQASFWEHTVVEGTRGVERGGWMLTGGITFYKSPITFLRTRIAGSAAEDAVNIIHTSFRFDHTEIGDTVSDAFDGDFTSGVITDSSFHDIGGDPIDVSGSTVTAQNVFIRNVGDKAISAGESSNVEVARLDVDNVGIGVASKDRSRISISNSTLGTFVNAGLAAYTKKQEFGPGIIVATNVKLEGETNPTIIQTGSWIQMDGKRLGGTDLDVQALYEAGILGN